MPRRLSRPARQVWRFGKAFASTGAERTKVREHPKPRTHPGMPGWDPLVWDPAAKTKPKPKIAGRAESLRYRGWRRHRSNGTRFSKLMRSRSPNPRRYCTLLRAKTHLCGRRCSRGTNLQSLAHPRGRKREPRGWSAPRAALITRVEAVVAARRVLGVGVPRARRPTTVLHGRRVIQRVLPISRVR